MEPHGRDIHAAADAERAQLISERSKLCPAPTDHHVLGALAIDRDLQGTHLELGLDFLRKHGESEPVLMAVAAHHMDIDWPSLEAMIVQAADAISAARPGARRDILESYVKRLEKLEGIADSFEGVSKSFALQAGREIRIMVESEKISDEEAVWLSKDIARRIENELEYPGQIKVTVIRETRAVDYAK